MPFPNHQRENLNVLCTVWGMQTSCANRLRHPTLKQWTISLICRGKRLFRGDEVKDLENGLKIPRGWMTVVRLRSKGCTSLRIRYAQLPDGTRELIDEMLDFTLCEIADGAPRPIK
jgi:hypothetical protein